MYGKPENFGTWNIDHFYQEMASELSELVGPEVYLPDGKDENQAVEMVYQLCRRHGGQVAEGMNRMRSRHEDLYEDLKENSLLKLIADREYLKDSVERLVASLWETIEEAIPRMFSVHLPTNEADLNLKINALLESHDFDFRREHPVVTFAGGRAVPDHGNEKHDVLIESKYIRSNTTPSKASEGIAADLIKYPEESHILFVVYDPTRAISDDSQFRNEFECRGRCTVMVVR